MIDLLYLVRKGESNEELRYSLRSVSANLPHDRVWVAGYRPKWLRDVRHVSTTQEGDRYRNVRAAWLAMFEVPDAPEWVILFNDDFFVVSPTEPEKVEAWHRGTVREVVDVQYAGHRSGYLRRLERTGDLLRQAGFGDPLCFELHVPMPVHLPTMAATCARFPDYRTHVRTLYGNVAGVDSPRRGDCKVYMRNEGIPADADFVSTTDRLFERGEAGRQLREMFPDASPYEQ